MDTYTELRQWIEEEVKWTPEVNKILNKIDEELEKE